MEDGKITLTMDIKRAYSVMRSLELVARIGMGQFKEIAEFMHPFMDWDSKNEIEIYLKEKLKPELTSNAYYGVACDRVPIDSKVAWGAYQHIRRELSWARAGKDWRKDQRVWGEMGGVNFDNPMKVDGLPGDFETSIQKGV
jgi:hypothetical protein